MHIMPFLYFKDQKIKNRTSLVYTPKPKFLQEKNVYLISAIA